MHENKDRATRTPLQLPWKYTNIVDTFMLNLLTLCF